MGLLQVPFHSIPLLLLLHPTAPKFPRAAGSYLCCLTPDMSPPGFLFFLQEVCSSSVLLSSSLETISIPCLACHLLPLHPTSQSVVPEILHLILGQFKGC